MGNLGSERLLQGDFGRPKQCWYRACQASRRSSTHQERLNEFDRSAGNWYQYVRPLLWDIGLLISDACDMTLHITQAFSNTPYRGSFDRIVAHNPTNAAVQDEGTGAALGVGSWHGRA